jgi:hypothetical protein
MSEPLDTSEPSPEGALVMVASFPDELGAMLCVADLKSDGIPAVSSGALTSQWRADVPGLVKVLVRACDELRARAFLQECAAHPLTAEELDDQSANWSGEEDAV